VNICSGSLSRAAEQFQVASILTQMHEHACLTCVSADLVASIAAACPVLAALLRQGPQQQQQPTAAAAAAAAGVSYAGILAARMLRLFCFLIDAQPITNVQQPAVLLPMAGLAVAVLAALPSSSTGSTCTQQQQQLPLPESSCNGTNDVSKDTSAIGRNTTAGGSSNSSSAVGSVTNKAAAAADNTAMQQPALLSYTAALQPAALLLRPSGSNNQGGNDECRAVLERVRSVAKAAVSSMRGERRCASSSGSVGGAAAWEAYVVSRQPALNDLGLLLYVHLAWLVQQQFELQERGSSSSSEGWGRQQQSIPAWHQQFLAAAGAAPWDPAWGAAQGEAGWAKLHDDVDSALSALNLLLRMSETCTDGCSNQTDVCRSSGSSSSGAVSRAQGRGLQVCPALRRRCCCWRWCCWVAWTDSLSRMI
jgi:hypothetical protein